MIKQFLAKFITKHIFKGLTESKFIDEMTEAEKNKFCSDCYNLMQNKTLKRILDKLINQQVNATVREANNMDAVMFGRGNLNALEVLKEEIKKYGGKHKDRVSPNKSFNKHEII